MILSWEWRKTLSVILGVWLLLSLWKSRFASRLAPTYAPPSVRWPATSVQEAQEQLIRRDAVDRVLPPRRDVSNRSFVGVACTVARKGDAATAACEPFCAVEHREHHCSLCKCRACRFCDATSPQLNEHHAPQRHAASTRTSWQPSSEPARVAARPGLTNATTAATAAARAGSVSHSDGDFDGEGVGVSAVSRAPSAEVSLPTPQSTSMVVSGHKHTVALGVLTESRESPRFVALESTWLNQFEFVMVFEHRGTSISRALAAGWLGSRPACRQPVSPARLTVPAPVARAGHTPTSRACSKSGSTYRCGCMLAGLRGWATQLLRAARQGHAMASGSPCRDARRPGENGESHRGLKPWLHAGRYKRFPHAHFYLIIDDDVYIHHGGALVRIGRHAARHALSQRRLP
mgnify:CR=1 FL=1